MSEVMMETESPRAERKSSKAAKSKSKTKGAPGMDATKGPMPIEALKKTFDMFDTDHSGNLELSELNHACKELGIQCTDNSAKKVFKMLDTDGSGNIDWNEFQMFFGKVSDPDEIKGLLSAHNQRFSDYKFRVKTDPAILREFKTPPSLPVAQLFRGHTNNVVSTAWLTEDSFASCSLDGCLMEWNANERGPAVKAAKATQVSDSGVYCMDAVFGSGNLLMGMGCNADNLGLWSLAENKIVRFYEGHVKSVFTCSMTASQTMAASGDIQGSLLLHDIERGDCLSRWSAHENVLTKCHFDQGEKRICTASRDGHVKVFDIGQKDLPVATIEDAAASELVSCVMWCKEYEVISCGGDYCIKRWDIRKPTMPPIACYMGHTSRVSALTVSADGHFAASGSDDGAVRVWEIDGQAKQSEMLLGKVNSIAEKMHELHREIEKKTEDLWSGEGDRAEIADMTQMYEELGREYQKLASEQRSAGNLDTLKACLDLNDHRGPVTALAWWAGPGRARVISGGGDQSVQLADMDLAPFMDS